MLTELNLSLWLRCATDPILTLVDNTCVCVTVLWVCVTESRPISGRFCTAPNSQTLWSGRQSWQSWHLSLSGWERMVCEWPGAGWDTLNHLHHVSVGLHAWVCTSGCSRICLCMRDDLQMFRLCTALLCCAHSAWRMPILVYMPAKAQIHI